MQKLSALKIQLEKNGLDVLHAFPAGLAAAHLPRGCSSQTALLIASSKAFWPAFLGHVKSDSTFIEVDDPVDRYTKEAVEIAAQTCFEPSADLEFYYPFELGPRFLDFQRIAHVSGLGYLSPASRLLVHPTLGPWISLRALILIPDSFTSKVPDPSQSFNPPPNPSLDSLIRSKMDALIALAESGSTIQWPALVEIRDMQASILLSDADIAKVRFGQRQIGYHYTKEKRYILEELEANEPKFALITPSTP